MDPVVVFTTTSDIEASVVTALLDSHGIVSFRISGNPQAIWPMAVNALGDIRIAVADDDAEAARRIIDSHREDVGTRVVRLRDEFEELQQRVGYRFKDRGLLEHALTHKSRAAEDASGGVADNESLEFLGDAVLGLVVADLLFRRYPTYNEGQKSKIKAAVVSTQSLGRHAEQLRLGEHLILGRGEEKTGGRFKQALLADAYEALIAAIYLDGGLPAAAGFLERELNEAIDAGAQQTVVGQDYKSALQERLQALGRPLPEYRLAGEAGPDHRKLFSVEVVVAGEVLGAATGRAKKEAEQEAARLALARLSTPDSRDANSQSLFSRSR
jgi:ribonuclease-3